MKEIATNEINKPIADFEVNRIRQDFPILNQSVNGNPLVYLDNAATSQKPELVIAAVSDYYRRFNSNVHRGAHHLSTLATDAYEAARESVRTFINARSIREINFTRGTTEAINLVSYTYGRTFIGKNDEVLISAMEHHSNIVPWQMLCEATGAKLSVIPVTTAGELDLSNLEELINERTKLVALVHTSNALGTINPVKAVIQAAHAKGAKVLLDAAQAMPHGQVDVRALDCDFLCFSGHKMFAPTGIGVLYGKSELLEAMPPFHGGGEMIKEVTFERTTYNDLPYKFEAGTPNIAGALGLQAAIRYLDKIGIAQVQQHEQELLAYASQKLQEIGGLKLVGTAQRKVSVVSFNIDGIHPYDIGTLLDQLGIAVRTGHHCCQPLMNEFGIEGTCRASFALYNTLEEVDVLCEGIHKAIKLLR